MAQPSYSALPLNRVEPLLDEMERFLHPVVAVPGLGAPLVDEKGCQHASHTKKKMCRNSDYQFARLKAKKCVRKEPKATDSPYQDISSLNSTYSTTAYTSEVTRNRPAAVMLRL